MDSDANDLNSRERLRWGDNCKFYTRKRRRTLENTNTDDTPATTATVTSTTAAPEVTSNSGRDTNENDNVPQPSLQTLDAEESKSPEQPEEQHEEEEEEAVIQFRDSSTLKGGTDSEQVAVSNGGEVRELTEDSYGRDVPAGGGAEPLVELKGGEMREPAEGSCGRDVPEGSGGGGSGGEVPEGSSGSQPAMQNHRDEPQSGNLEVENGYVKPVISRIQDRIRINLTGVRSGDEIRELSMSIESELDQVRSLVKELEAKQLQLTTYRTSINGGNINAGSVTTVPGSINAGSITTVPGGSISSYSHPQYMDNGVIKNRSLAQVNSDVRSAGHIGSRPFQRPSFLIVENSNGSSDFVEKEKRTPKANQYYRNSEFLLGKDRLPPESNKRPKPNGSGKKHSADSENGFAFGFGFDKHRLQVFRNCSSLLQRLMKHKHGWVFNEPVNAKALGLHDYHVIIKHPMDLGTIKTRLSQNWYKSPREFAEDVRLVFRNAMTYNPKGQDVHVMAEHLSEIFEERWAVIETEYNSDWRYQTYHDGGTPTPTSRRTSIAPSFLHTSVASHSLAPHARQLQTLDRSESMTRPVNPKMKTSNIVHVARTPIPKKPKAKDPNKRDMTYEEKQKLSTNLQSLPSEKLDAIVQIIKKRNSTLSQDNDEIEVDIDSVDAETLWELDRFVTNFKKSFSKYKRKAELALRAREGAARIVNPTSLVADALKENGTGEKDTTPATLTEGGRPVDSASRSSSSSSSSSDSGSSSSDSDSDSSSASGSEAAHSPRT